MPDIISSTGLLYQALANALTEIGRRHGPQAIKTYQKYFDAVAAIDPI